MGLSADITQRWKDRRDSYRRRGESFHPDEYGVELLTTDRQAKEFVERNHYSASYPAARVRVGLYRKREGWFTSELVGVAVYSVPMQQSVIPCYAPTCKPQEGIELGRFVLLDEVPFNAESWFLARAEAALRATLPDLRVIVSFSDPLPRHDHKGNVITPGHIGAIYQARNAWYLGRNASKWHHLTPEGHFLSQRALSKIRNQEQGHEGAMRTLLNHGAPPRKPGESPDAWVARALKEGPFTRVQHPGNHVYLWVLDPSATAGIAVQKYPKKQAAA